MLWQLSIKNLAIIDDISMEFSDGFNILTGETGAGKSIIIDAINLIIGGRADRELIRTGEQSAIIEAIFTLESNPQLVKMLEEQDFIDDDSTELLITRQIYSNGRNVNKINGRAVVTSVLKDIASYLIDIHGQHQHQSLLNKTWHMGFLDSFDSEIGYLKSQVADLYSKWRSLREKIDEIDRSSEDFERNKELMEYQISEIDDAGLKIGEDDELLEKKQVLKNAEAIKAALETVYECLNSGRRDGAGALEQLYSAKEKLGTIAEYTEEYSQLYDAADNIYYELEDLGDTVARLLRRADYSPELAEEIDDRLYTINSLKRKYGKTIESILAFRDGLEKELEEMQFNMDNSQQLHKEEKEVHRQLMATCDVLHNRRIDAADRLRDRIIDELAFLGMKKVQFEAVVEADKESPSATGYDDVEFFISPNVGEAMKPLAKIASGGEVSRIMLSIKSALADIDGIPTMIFDEIDTGISGAVTGAVGTKMKTLAENHQIICITHQAQIAALADQHFFVSKSAKDGKTKTNVKILDIDERTEHLAQMISGSTVTDAARAHARKLMGID